MLLTMKTKQPLYRNEKANYLKIALALNGIGITEQFADLIVLNYERILIKQGRFSIKDAVELQLNHERYFKEIEIKAAQSKEKET